MPFFTLLWTETAVDQLGDTIVIRDGRALIEACSLETITDEINKYRGAETNYQQGITVNEIMPSSQEDEPVLSFSQIADWLDPWQTIKR